jgi:hypothetical protein
VSRRKHNVPVDGDGKFVCALALLFGLPFCLFGLSVLSHGLHTNSLSAPTLIATSFGLLFLIGGTTLIGGIFWATSRSRRQNTVRSDNPSSPWLWRPDWAAGRCNSNTRSAMITAWVMSVIWNAASAPTLFLVPQQTYREKPLTLLALAFPAVGAYLLVRAIRETLAWFEFGKTYFQMTAVPLVIGREMRGAIQARFPKPPEHGIRVKLSCVNRIVTGSGKDQTTRENIVWRAEHTVSAGELYASPTGTTIPVSFHIPLDARQTDYSNPRNSVLWLLEADADVPGVDYKDLFELPVFRTKDTPSHAETTEFSESAAKIGPPASPTVHVTPTAQGTEFYFPAARNKGFAAGMTAFFMLWTGVLVLIFHLHAPFIFPVVFGLFELLFFYIVLQMWFGTSIVIVNNGQLRVRNGLFGSGKWQELPLSEMSAINAVIRSQQGGASGTPYYNIELIRTDGRKITLGESVRDKEEAEWLVSEMRNRLGWQAAKAASAN